MSDRITRTTEYLGRVCVGILSAAVIGGCWWLAFFDGMPGFAWAAIPWAFPLWMAITGKPIFGSEGDLMD